jgi:hypothetical protein
LAPWPEADLRLGGVAQARRGRLQRQAAIAVLALALGAAGCGGVSAPGPSGGDPCDPAGLVGDPSFDPVALCREAIQLADAELGLVHAPVARVRVRSDMCPPGARCLAPVGVEHWVIYEYWFGPPRMVYVGPPDPVDDQSLPLDARGPEPLPDWLLDELGIDG